MPSHGEEAPGAGPGLAKAPWWPLVPLLPLMLPPPTSPLTLLVTELELQRRAATGMDERILGPFFLPVSPPDLVMHSLISRLVLCCSIPWSMPPSIYACSSPFTDLQISKVTEDIYLGKKYKKGNVIMIFLCEHRLCGAFLLTTRWGPQFEQATYKNRQRLYLSEQRCFQTDGSVPITLVIANCEVVKPRVAVAEHISQFNEEARSLFVKKYKTIIHPGEVNRIREMALSPWTRSVALVWTSSSCCCRCRWTRHEPSWLLPPPTPLT